MPPRRRTDPQVNELQSLAGDPAAQTALAVRVLANQPEAQAARAALDVLRERPTPTARPALLRCFAFYAANGVRRDAGGYLRAAIVSALRPVAQPEDVPLFEQAATTYEFLPPGRSEETWLLRSAALVALNELDSELASYHAVRLLADRYTSPLSGEPALTAIRLLAAQNNRWPLYYYLLHLYAHPGRPTEPVPEVVSECLKSLAGVPPSLLPELIERYGTASDEVVLVGLIDLLLAYPEAATAQDFIAQFLRAAQQPGAYRYLVARLVAERGSPLRPALIEAAAHERDPRRLGVLAEALALGQADPALKAALAGVRRQLSSQGESDEP